MIGPLLATAIILCLVGTAVPATPEASQTPCAKHQIEICDLFDNTYYCLCALRAKLQGRRKSKIPYTFTRKLERNM